MSRSKMRSGASIPGVPRRVGGASLGEMPRFDMFLAAVVSLGLGACTAEIRVEDDDDGEGAGQGVGGAGADTTAASGAPTSSSATGGASVEAARGELAEACDTICTTRCIETSAYCERDCTDAVDECVDEKLAYIQCRLPGSTGPCPEEANPEACEELRWASRSCGNRYDCGATEYAEQIVCAPYAADSCECDSPCNEGHRGVAACRTGNVEVICDCYLDDAYKGECRYSGNSLNCFSMGCCQPLLR